MSVALDWRTATNEVEESANRIRTYPNPNIVGTILPSSAGAIQSESIKFRDQDIINFGNRK